MQAVLHHYVTVAAVQPHIMGDYKEEALRVMFTVDDFRYSRSFLGAFEILFSDRRGRDSRQVWNVNSANENKLCFRKLIWSPKFPGGTSLLVNRDHKHQSCFSSIIYSYSAYLKAALHIPTLPRPRKPRVVWVGRDTSLEANPNSWQKQRIIHNQAQVVVFLKEACAKLGIELIVADFYAEKKDTPFQEQALFVSRANIMIGIHGAGLNMFHFMPFNSVVVEIHRGTTANKNSRNFVNHIKEGAYFTTSVSTSKKELNVNEIWKILENAIDKWKQLR